MRDNDQEKKRETSRQADSQITGLAGRARAGDRMAFTRLMDLFHGEIFRMAFYRTGSRMDAEDVTQDIFLKAYRNISGLKEVEKFRSWLFSIAVNRIKDFYRKKRFRSFLGVTTNSDEVEMAEEEIDENPTGIDNLIKQEFWSQVGSMLKKLPKMEKEIFLLRFFDDLGIREISEALGKSESTVKTHLYRALKKVKKDSSRLKTLAGKTA